MYKGYTANNARCASGTTQSKSATSTPAAESMYDNAVLAGKRSTPTPSWFYRCNRDTHLPRVQLDDLGNGTLPHAASRVEAERVRQLSVASYTIEAVDVWSDDDFVRDRKIRIADDGPDFGGLTALHRAARAGDFDTAHLLLHHGANPYVERRNGRSLLAILAGDGDSNMIRHLLEYGQGFCTLNLQSAVGQATLYGYIGVVSCLLDFGGNNIRIHSNHCSLWKAVDCGHEHVVELRLREGCIPRFLPFVGSSILAHALVIGHVECARLLILYGAYLETRVGQISANALTIACGMAQEEVVKFLLQRKTDPNQKLGPRAE